MRYEDLSSGARTEAARAAREFMQKNGYISLMEACESLDLTLQQLWDSIMEEAGLPACEVPAFAAFG